MEGDRPAPDEALNPGPPVTPRPAATVILMRGAAERLEILLVKRNPRARFMGGAWVFPGGAVDRHEGRGDSALRAAALRELQEEAGIQLTDPQALIGFSRWITPEEIKIRFDTWFYLAAAPPDVEARVDGHEVVEARWYEPANALEAARTGEITLVFPTIKHLEQLAGFRSATELADYARQRKIEPVLPRVLVSGEIARIVLPDEPGYER
ncbi:MAG TPA: NUDIX hydrolase [Solirubrobacteraceae bacterium]|jgi:8-oxo-dGTP pyrophosphatase MutT (NUDIX family)|nr:NUDIX hydrolase [Solirubrobacteraceae bacterium]